MTGKQETTDKIHKGRAPA